MLQKPCHSFPSEGCRQVVLKLVCLSKLPLEFFKNKLPASFLRDSDLIDLG